MAHVAVDDEHLSSLECQRHGEVHRDERLARPGVERGQGDDAVPVARAAHELGVGPQYPEGLVDDVALATLHDDGVDLKVLAPGLLA